MLAFAFGLLVGSTLSCVWAVSNSAPRWVLYVARACLVFALAHIVVITGGLLLAVVGADSEGAFELAPWAGATFAIAVLAIAMLRTLARSRPEKPSPSSHGGVYRTAALDLRSTRYVTPSVPAPGGVEEALRVLTVMLSLFGVFVALAVGGIGLVLMFPT